MELFNPNSKIDFMGARRWAALASALIFIVSIGGLLINGLHWGLDFTGGTQIEISYQNAANLNQIRESLAKAGFNDPQVVSYGTSRDVLISIAPRANQNQTDLVETVMSATSRERQSSGWMW